MGEYIRRFYSIMRSQFGLDPQRGLRSLRKIPRFIATYRQFRREYEGRIVFRPCLYDASESAGSAGDEYFWQDLYVAQKVHAAGPDRHVDVGSRIDGFVAHVASYRDIEVFDVRPLSTRIPRVTFTQADLTSLSDKFDDYCDSLSCLHTLEHFGLGRYGDSIDGDGHRKGLRKLARMVRPGGTFYLSVPVGRERVEFNAHRVFDARKLVALVEHEGLLFEQSALFTRAKGLEEVSLSDAVERATASDYALIILTLRRPPS
jgi:SAM-dependent methyltransferase